MHRRRLRDLTFQLKLIYSDNALGRTVEITEGISHRLRLRNSPSPLKPIYSDNAQRQDHDHQSALPTDFTDLKSIGWGWMVRSTILDDFSRYVSAWQLCTTMTSRDVTATLELALQASGCDQADAVHWKRRIHHGSYSNWHWHLDEVFVRVNGEIHYLWRAQALLCKF